MKRRWAIAATALLTGCSGTAPTPAPSAAPPVAPKILQFFPSPATVAKGGRTLLCYGVEGAKEVQIEPRVEELSPSLARCIEVQPAATTKYTLIAKGAGGETSQSVTVPVDGAGAAAPAGGGPILFFNSLSGKIAKGGTATLCYGVKDAESVTLAPAVAPLVPSERLCFQVKPEATTAYVLTARSAAGKAGSATVRVAVE